MGWLANAFAVSAVDWLLKAKATNFGISELLHRFLFGIVFGCHVSWSACPSVKFLPYFCINVVIFNVFSADMRTVFLRGRGGSVLKLWINVDKALKRNCWFKKKKNRIGLFIPFFFGSLSEMTHVSVHVTEFNEYQHFLTVPSVLFLVLVPAPAFKKNQPLTFFPFLLPLLTISSSCGTQPDRSAFVNPWCNTTTVTSTRCSSFMMSPLLPALAAWLPG